MLRRFPLWVRWTRESGFVLDGDATWQGRNPVLSIEATELLNSGPVQKRLYSIGEELVTHRNFSADAAKMARR